jgi:RimJ/RimL family protein N-acetyltransferase
MQDEETKKALMATPNSFKEAKIEVQEKIEKAKTKVSETFTIEIDEKFAGTVTIEYQNYDVLSDEGRVHLVIHPNFRGKGLATKALTALVEYAFNERKFKILYGQTKVSNIAIAKVFEKVGFNLEKIHTVEGIKKHWWSLRRQVQ